MIGELAAALRNYADRRPGPGPYITVVEGFMILRSDHAKPPSHIISKPALCVVAQGAKWTSFGSRRFDYRAGQALLVTVESPSVGRITGASPSEPFLGAILEFDPAILQAVLEDVPVTDAANRSQSGTTVIDLDGPLVDCVLRLVRLLETPSAVPMLSPMIKREVFYWLLQGSHGPQIAQMVLGNDHPRHVVDAIHALRQRFSQSVPIADLAAIARLGTSAFHRRFKQITSLTPNQYQKQLRLMEARRLMISEGAKVETAAFEVGYQSASQFSREYSRMFGVPPKRDSAARYGRPDAG